MAYATVQDMVARFGDLEVMQITDRLNTGEIDPEVAMVALDDATAEIDAYLGRFARPFAETPPILKRLCCDIARYRLSATSGVLITEEVRNRYKIDVLDLLRAIAKGEVQLGVDALGEEVATSENGVLFVNGKNKVFARDKSY